MIIIFGSRYKAPLVFFLRLDFEVSDDVIEDIALRLCFVTTLERGLQIQKIRQDASSVSGLSSFLNKSVPTAAYPIGGSGINGVGKKTQPF